MKAIEVKRGDKVLYNGDKCIIVATRLNHVLVKSENGSIKTASYSQIEKYEPKQIDREKQGS